MAVKLCKVRQLSPKIMKVEEAAAEICRPRLNLHSNLFTAGQHELQQGSQGVLSVKLGRLAECKATEWTPRYTACEADSSHSIWTK